MEENNCQQILLHKDFWTSATPDGSPRLIGSHCGNCGEVYFPKKPKGWCVHCQQQALEDVLLSPRGRISTFTVVRQQPAGGFFQRDGGDGHLVDPPSPPVQAAQTSPYSTYLMAAASSPQHGHCGLGSTLSSVKRWYKAS